jgi:hypothetical protein
VSPIHPPSPSVNHLSPSIHPPSTTPPSATTPALAAVAPR